MGLLGLPGFAAAGACAVAIAAGAHGAWIIEVARRRRRPALDWGLRLVLTAAVFLRAGVRTRSRAGPRLAFGTACCAHLRRAAARRLDLADHCGNDAEDRSVLGVVPSVCPPGRPPPGPDARPRCRGPWPRARPTRSSSRASRSCPQRSRLAMRPDPRGRTVLTLGAVAFAAALVRVLWHLASGRSAPLAAKASCPMSSAT